MYVLGDTASCFCIKWLTNYSGIVKLLRRLGGFAIIRIK